MEKKNKDYTEYQKHFNVPAMWRKLTGAAKKAGAKVAYGVLLLYYASIDPKTPAADKAKIYGAIGYFILPLDLLPDIFPMLGYTDDLAAVVWALKAVWRNITPEVRAKARRRLDGWFGSVDESELKLLPQALDGED